MNVQKGNGRTKRDYNIRNLLLLLFLLLLLIFELKMNLREFTRVRVR